MAGTYTVAVQYIDNDGQWGNIYTFQITISGLKRLYYVKDHLGSIRVTVDQTGNVVSADDYDPWGMQLAGRSYNAGDANDKLKFIGVERDKETGYDATGPRFYDSRIGRFNRPDRFDFLFPNVSSYSYSFNNPIVFSDASGDSSKPTNMTEEEINSMNAPNPIQGLTTWPNGNSNSSSTSDGGGSSGSSKCFSPNSTLTALGFVNSSVENYVHNQYTTMGFNYKSYSNSLRGNRYRRGVNAGKRLSRPLKAVGIVIFGVNTVVTLTNSKLNEGTQIYEITLDAIGTFGGLYGFAANQGINYLMDREEEAMIWNNTHIMIQPSGADFTRVSAPYDLE